MTEEQTKKVGVSGGKVIITALIVAIVFGGGAYAYVSSKAAKEKKDLNAQITELQSQVSSTKTATTTPSSTTSTTATTDETVSWKTYSNDTVGFSIKYPTTWTLVNSGAGPELAYLQSPKNVVAGKCRSVGCDLPSTMKILEYSIGGTNLKSYLDKQAALSDPTYTNVQSIKIGSVDGYSADKGPGQLGGGTSYFVQSKTNTSDAIEFWFFSNDSDYSSSNTQKILSTFQFTK